MIPKSKNQKRVISLARYLKPLNSRQEKWGKNLFNKYVYVRKDTLTCFECGNTWDAKYYNDGDYRCPVCKTKLIKWDEKTAKGNLTRQYRDYYYFSIFTVVKEYQVLRYFRVNKYCKVGKPSEFITHEVYQHWISNKGNRYIVSRLRVPFSYYRFDQWNYNSELEIRHISQSHLINNIPMYPIRRLLPEIIRNGWYGDYYDMHPSVLFTLILGDHIAETLIKTDQFDLLKSYTRYKDEIKRYWPSIKICIRNNYRIDYADIWLDHLKLLEYFHKDIRNAKYICLKDLRHEHQILIDKKQVIEDRKEYKKLLKKIEDDDIVYQKNKSKFIGLKFINDNLSVSVLNNVHEFYYEGKEMHHCVFSNGYYKKNDILIMSGKNGNKRIATLEFSLKSMKVTQCRGKCNQVLTEQNKLIGLVNNNINQIKSIIDGKSKRTKKNINQPATV